MSDLLPKQGAPVVGPDGMARNEWWLFWRSQAETLVANGVPPEVIADIEARLAALETSDSFQLVGLDSVVIYGTPQQGAVTVTLVGDSSNLGPTWFYGTLPGGARGWQRLFDAMEAPNDGISLTDSGYLIDGIVPAVADLPGGGTIGHAYRVLGIGGLDTPGLYFWNGSAYVLDPAATGVVGVIATDDLAALEALTGAGLAARTGTDTWELRTIQNGPGVDWTNPGGVAGDPQATFNSHTAPVDRIAGSTYSTVQDYINTMTSPGTIDGPALCIVESGIPATPIRVLAGKGMIRTADDDVSSLPFFDWAQTDFAQPADGLTRFYGVVYNAGTPIVQQRTTFNWDKDTEIPLGSAVIFTGGIAVITPNAYKTGDADTNIIQRFDAQAPATRDNSIGGLILGETGTRNATLTAGKIWSRLSDFDSPAKNSATTPMLSAFFNGAGLTVTSGLTQWDNTRYNNLGSGTLVAMGLNKYANLWFFISIDGTKWGFAYGTNEYNTLGAAANEGVPAYLNQNFFQQALLLGRLIFQQGAATASLIESAFAQIFSTTAINNHNDLNGIQDAPNAVVNEHYHLSSAQGTAVANAVSTGGGFVTVSGTQTVTGAKTFSAPVVINNNLTVGTTALVAVDATDRVGIGRTPVNFKLEIEGSDAGIDIIGTGGATSFVSIGDAGPTAGGQMRSIGSGGVAITSRNAGTTFMNMTPTGVNLSVSTNMNAGARLTGAAFPAFFINATGNPVDARLCNFFLDTGGGLVLNVVNDANTISFGNLILQRNGDVTPGTDNNKNLGTASVRWREVFAGIGAINTSDEREKLPPLDLSPQELAAATELARCICVYQWKDAVAAKGVDGARLHVGWIAQEVRDVMESHGLDGFRYGFLCYDEWPEQQEEWMETPAIAPIVDDDGAVIDPGSPATRCLVRPYRPAGNLFGLRKDELTAFIIAAQEQRLQALEARLA